MNWIRDYYQYKWVENPDLRYGFETTAGENSHNALENFCASMLCKRNAECQFNAVRDFLQEVPVAIGSYLYYEYLCEDMDELCFDPRCRDQTHLCRFHIHDDDKIYESKPNDE
ncbi:hypothetical protein BOTCAL_0002g00650 [Botryotinia calthae]|uniref:Uncharacterized protein n=1 Tax=Botryotinia calthae TaxID=38488 RepID=A0A4Y8DK87_9HELO|nr:hypothetical protein BOTCAL_0002g00650 [Botryotinia calthae]